MVQTNVNTPYDFIISKVVINSQRMISDFDISNVTMDVSIFEHIDKPYLTAQILFLDQIDLVSKMNLLGTEEVYIEITKDLNDPAELSVKHTFRISHIELSKKANDTNEIHKLHLVEETAYRSAITRINRTFTGSAADIIFDICFDYLDQLVLFTPEAQTALNKRLKVHIPNLTPYEAVNWIKDRCFTETGSPFYLHASIGDSILRFADLESIVRFPAYNSDRPFVYSQALMNDTIDKDTQAQGRSIISYQTLNQEDTLSFYREGMVNADYNFVDTLTGVNHRVKFDMNKVYDDFLESRAISGQKLLDDQTFIGDQKMIDYSTREMVQIATSQTYEDFANYYEDFEETHALKPTARALRSWVLKPEIQITLPGREFIKVGENRSLGITIAVEFNKNTEAAEFLQEYSKPIDYKKSGKYFIYAARHTFSNNTYFVNLSLGKLSHLTSSTIPQTQTDF